MRLALLVGAFLPILCTSERIQGIVRSKKKAMNTRLDVGEIASEDGKPLVQSHVGQISQEGGKPLVQSSRVGVVSQGSTSFATKASTSVASSAAVNVYVQGPTKAENLSDDADHPNVVDTIPYASDTSPIDADASSSSIPTFFILMCAAGGIVWFYTTHQQRKVQYDGSAEAMLRLEMDEKWEKRNDTAMGMLEPMVRDASAVIGEAVKAAGQVQVHACKAAKAAGLPEDLLTFANNDDKDDDLLKFDDNEPEEKDLDQYANRASVGFFPPDEDDEPEEAPTLMQVPEREFEF